MPRPQVTVRIFPDAAASAAPSPDEHASYRHFVVHGAYQGLSNGFATYDEMTDHTLERGTPA